MYKLTDGGPVGPNPLPLSLPLSPTQPRRATQGGRTMTCGLPLLLLRLRARGGGGGGDSQCLVPWVPIIIHGCWYPYLPLEKSKVVLRVINKGENGLSGKPLKQ